MCNNSRLPLNPDIDSSSLLDTEDPHFRFSKRPAQHGVDQDGDCLPSTRESPLLRSEGAERTDESISTCVASLSAQVLFVSRIHQVSVSRILLEEGS